MDLVHCTRFSHASARKRDQSCTPCRFFRTDALTSQLRFATVMAIFCQLPFYLLQPLCQLGHLLVCLCQLRAELPILLLKLCDAFFCAHCPIVAALPTPPELLRQFSALSIYHVKWNRCILSNLILLC